MSDQNVFVEQLELKKKGHKLKLKRKIRQEHGTFYVAIPMSIRQKIGMKLNDEVVIEPVSTNPLLWEIRIKSAERR